MTLMQVVVAAFAQCGQGKFWLDSLQCLICRRPGEAGTQRLERTLKSLGPGFRRGDESVVLNTSRLTFHRIDVLPHGFAMLLPLRFHSCQNCDCRLP